MTDATAAPAATTEKKDVVPSQYRERYKESGGTCGDFIANALQKIAKDGTGSLDTVKSENDIEADRWSTFNPGMQRMNLANVLRGKYLNGASVVILGKQYNAKHQAEEANFTVENTPAALSKLASYLELQDNDRTKSALAKLFFPPEKKAATGKTAEEKAAEKAAKAALKDGDKAHKAAKRDLEKAQKAEKKAGETLAKVQGELATANEESTKASAAVKDAADDAAKTAANKALTKANDKAGKLEDRVHEASTKFDTFVETTKVAQAKVDETAPAPAATAE